MSLKEQLERRMAGLPPPCVETGKTPLTLAVYLTTGETWLLPWARFSHARLRGEELTVAFADREVVMRGQNLASVAKDAMSFSLEILRAVPAEYRPLVPAAEPFILEIEVRESGQ